MHTISNSNDVVLLPKNECQPPKTPASALLLRETLISMAPLCKATMKKDEEQIKFVCRCSIDDGYIKSYASSV